MDLLWLQVQGHQFHHHHRPRRCMDAAGTEPADDGVRISMPLFMRVRGEGEHGIEELELKEE
eukprot:COSAG02_NODE_50232_length_322_cov_0.426009_1_plen_61_part_01